MWYNEFGRLRQHIQYIKYPGWTQGARTEKPDEIRNKKSEVSRCTAEEAREMKLSGTAFAILAAVLLALAVMGGFFLGRNTTGEPVRVITRNSAHLPGYTQSDTAPSPDRPAPEQSGQPDLFPIDINTATAEELQALPGIGKTRAEAIVAYREEHGEFTYVEDLKAVSGIGEGILENIIDYITVGERNNG